MEGAMSLKRNIKLIKAHTVCSNMLFMLPVIVPYYNSIGLTFRDFLIGEAVFSASVLLCEVPSGWISDVWRRKTTLMIGALLFVGGCCGLMLANGFWAATFMQVIFGVSIALGSGTNTALLYDSLADAGREEEYRRIDGNRHGAGIYGTAVACMAGALLFAVDPKLPLLFDAVIMIIAMIIVACIDEPHRHKKSVERHMFHDMWMTMKYALSGHPEITGIIILSTVIFATTKLMLWAQQPFYMMIGVPVEWFGFILTAAYIIGGIAAQFGHCLEKRFGNRTALGFTAGTLVASCFLLVMLPPLWIAMPLFLTGTLTYAICSPRINNAINSRVGSERRATVLSTANLMVHFLFIPSSVLVGYLSEHGGIQLSLAWMGGQLLVLSALGLWLWSRQTIRSRVPA
ncbi:MAG: MFS transporter [Micavibrio aeruginosavorus]|uniref:MFS transporter n=1 Tax=Micavibrio aeruginosavorus TaxID=349221 RepID=A0A2W5Q0I9_9BACT|nr:MAG: MFS transporter [Micavibrio aeruginosavorus]